MRRPIRKPRLAQKPGLKIFDGRNLREMNVFRMENFLFFLAKSRPLAIRLDEDGSVNGIIKIIPIVAN
jgi:hypothetical protein